MLFSLLRQYYSKVVKPNVFARETFLFETCTANKYTYVCNLKYSKKVSKSGKRRASKSSVVRKRRNRAKAGLNGGRSKGEGSLRENVGAVEASCGRKQETNK